MATSTSPQSKPRTLRGELARHAVLDSAMARFAADGLRGTRIEEIARGAGVSRPTVYAHFESKEDIFRTLVVALHEQALDAMAAALAGGGTIEERLYRGLAARFGEFVEITASSPRGVELFEDGERLCADVLDDAHTRTLRLLREAVEDGQASGELDLDRSGLGPATAAAVIYDCSVGAKDDGRIKLAAYRRRLRQIVAALLGGLAAR